MVSLNGFLDIGAEKTTRPSCCGSPASTTRSKMCSTVVVVIYTVTHCETLSKFIHEVVEPNSSYECYTATATVLMTIRTIRKDDLV